MNHTHTLTSDVGLSYRRPVHVSLSSDSTTTAVCVVLRHKCSLPSYDTQSSLTFTETLAADVLRVIMRVVENTYVKMIHTEICLIQIRVVFICGVLLVVLFLPFV